MIENGFRPRLVALRLTAATAMTAKTVDPRGEQRRKHNLTSAPSAAMPLSHIDTGRIHTGVRDNVFLGGGASF